LRSLVGNKFGYNVIAACITTPTLYCSANQKPTTWTQKAPMHRRTGGNNLNDLSENQLARFRV